MQTSLGYAALQFIQDPKQDGSKSD